MSHQTSGLHLNEIFKNLSEIPFQYQNKNNALKRITELGKQTIDSHTFALAFIDPETKAVTQVVCTSNNSELEESINHKKVLWNDIASSTKGKPHPGIKDRYHLKSVYSYPLWSQESRIVGHIYHFSPQLETLTKYEQGLFKSFANRTIVTIENLNPYNTFNSLQTLCKLSEELMTVSPDKFIQLLPQNACELFSASACILWEKDLEHQKFKILATDGKVDDEYKKLELDSNFESLQNFYRQRGVFYLRDITKASAKFLHYEEVQKRGWVSMISAPLMVSGEIIGILDIFTTETRYFTELEKDQFKCFSNYAAISFEKAVTNQKTIENLKDREKSQKLTEIMLKMINCTDTEKILQSLLKGALELVILGNKNTVSLNSLICEISRLDYFTGELKTILQNRSKKQNPPLKLDEGITGKALKDKKTIRVNDISSSEIYVKHWEEARSEIAVPIFIENIPVRKGKEVQLGSKLIGVLNIESPEIKTFSEADEKYLSLLVRYAAILIDRLEADEKLSKLRRIEQEIAHHQNYDKIMIIALESITKILGFNYVNISLINRETNSIKTEYITGIPEAQIENFKKSNDHSSDSNDIQADIVINKKIEVPDTVDSRFDKQVYDNYDHQGLIRVFIPMIEPSRNQVIGTLEAGYKKHYREYIYERDVQILESLGNYAVHALERKKSKIVDQIFHELRSPIVGIRSNASFIHRRIEQITPELIDRKLEDILTDCEILLYQVADLDYAMGGRISQGAKIEKVLIFRDIILKTFNQLRPIVIDHKFSIESIDLSKVNPKFIGLKITTDKAKLNQVIYNLLMNSIKYAKADPNQFKIVIDIYDKNQDCLIIKFKDWGIGIEKEYKKDIFKEGFRCPEAIYKNVTGTGLGLAISKNIMKNLGGDLILSHNAEPTEFHLILPKQ